MKFFIQKIIAACFLILTISSSAFANFSYEFRANNNSFNSPLRITEGAESATVGFTFDVSGEPLSSCVITAQFTGNPSDTATLGSDYLTSGAIDDSDPNYIGYAYRALNDGISESTEYIYPTVLIALSGTYPNSQCSNQCDIGSDGCNAAVSCSQNCADISSEVVPRKIEAGSWIEVLDVTPQRDLIEVDLVTTQSMIEETASATSVAEVDFRLSDIAAYNGCQAKATVSIDGGTAVPGVHYIAPAQPMEFTFNSSSSSSFTEQIDLTPLNTGPGDGDKTVIFKAEFELLNNGDGESSYYCELSGTSPQTTTVTIKDSPTKYLTGSLNTLTSTVSAGSGVNKVAEFTFDLEGTDPPDSYCKATAELVLSDVGTAVEGQHFRFVPDVRTLSYGDGSRNVETLPINLEVLSGMPGEADKTVILQVRFESNGVVDDGFTANSCPLANSNPLTTEITLTGYPAAAELTVNFDRIREEVDEDEPAENVAEVSFRLPSGIQPNEQCQAVATISAVGGNAVNGKHYDFTTQTIRFGASDSSPKVVPVALNVRDTGPGDGDHSVTLQAEFSLVNTGSETTLSCELPNTSPIQQTIVIKDAETTKLTGDLRPVRDTVAAGSGTQVIADLELKLAGAARPDEYCSAEAYVRVISGGSAVEGEHYRFAATPPTLRYGAGSANFAKLPIELDVLPGSPGQGDKTVVLEARFSSSGVNQGDGRRNSCPLSGQSTERYTITITGSPADDVRTTLTPVSSGLFLEGLGNTGVAEVGFQLLSGSPPGENCRVVADISADAARSTAVEGEHFRIVTSQVSFGNGDGVTKTEQVIVELLDDNDPGNDSRTLLLVSRFTTGGSDCAVTAAEQNVSITIGNDPEANLQAQLSAESYSVVEGNQVRITLSFQEEAIAQTSFAQRPTGTCEVAAEWRVDGLQPADYRFDAPEIIRYSPDTPEVAYTLTLHEDRQREGVESFDVSVRLSQSDNNPCPLAASLVNTTVNLPNRIALNDGALSLDPASARAAEPEEILAQTCDAIRSYASAVEGEDQVVQAFLTARLSDNSLSDTKRSELEDRRRFYIDNCWDRGSQIANDLRDRNFEPEEVVSQGRALLNGATRQLGNVRARLNKLRTSDGERGLDISGIDLNIQDAAIPSAVTEGALGGAAGDEIDGLFEETRWGAFVNGEYAFGDKNRGDDKKPKSGDRNFEFNSKGLTVGVDYRFPGERFIAGAALGYKDFEAEFSSEDGGTSNQGYNFSVYGTYLLSEKSYFDAVLSYGRNQVKTVRPINQVSKDANGQPLLDQSGQLIVDEAFATGNPDADEIAFSVGGGYDFQIDEWTITPYGRVDYIKGKIDAYKEESATAFDNAGLYGINEQELESLSSSVGLKASKVISTSNGVFIPQASLEWKHEFKDRDLISGQTLHLVGDSQLDNDSLGVNADFLEDNSVNTGIDKDYFNINIGVSAVFPEGRSGYVNVESRLGDDTTEETAVKAGYRWEFF